MAFDPFDRRLYTEANSWSNQELQPDEVPTQVGIDHGGQDTGEDLVEFINLTPHTINVLDVDGEEHAIPASGQQARVAMSTADAGVINNFKITKQVTGEVTGLPPASPNKIYVVSAMIAQAAKRPDVVSPDTGPSAIRENGLIKAVKGFVTY